MPIIPMPYASHVPNDAWIIDSGASDHMSYDAKFLHDLRLFISVSLPNGQKVQVT